MRRGTPGRGHPHHPAGGEKEALRFALERDTGLGGGSAAGLVSGQQKGASGLGRGENRRNAGQKSQTSIGGSLKQLQTL